ncbi:SCP-like extracellular family protein [Coccidioides posadasii C735 delta SOWgp]|uniref:SCP domain-containing protein n=2 Tax=Coccidioides posadasii TaxID=199306 RepID=A0A0J6FP21_COCPO|nr:SCP-like extracellular family protein [Coccidioides posadasii C735 delta SOWgp]EER29831.1 SCP-like extracellular family protein [Coccidioides posadasii C735 delta SOWgp]KMM71185.1 hypothetical protein CPAG_07492 [Coccidioides posadasii RMSCC 3488]|eukprot:XP_003071976.1 SCP-like extracellular family protein [Coccidioides posadasii C735 delta SOWgp]
MGLVFIFSLVQLIWTVISEPTSPQFSSDEVFKTSILNATNSLRRQHDANPLTWNNTLAETAHDWGEQCRLRHSFSPSGENLAAGYPNITSVMTAWAQGREKVSFNNPKYNEETSQFTQLVWKSTKSVGCGRHNCGSAGMHPKGHHSEKKALGWYVVCEYYPPGNIIGGNQFRENVQRGQYIEQGGAIRTKDYGYRAWSIVVTVAAFSIGVLGMA